MEVMLGQGEVCELQHPEELEPDDLAAEDGDEQQDVAGDDDALDELLDRVVGLALVVLIFEKGDAVVVVYSKQERGGRNNQLQSLIINVSLILCCNFYMIRANLPLDYI